MPADTYPWHVFESGLSNTRSRQSTGLTPVVGAVPSAVQCLQWWGMASVQGWQCPWCLLGHPASDGRLCRALTPRTQWCDYGCSPCCWEPSLCLLTPRACPPDSPKLPQAPQYPFRKFFFCLNQAEMGSVTCSLEPGQAPLWFPYSEVSTGHILIDSVLVFLLYLQRAFGFAMVSAELLTPGSESSKRDLPCLSGAYRGAVSHFFSEVHRHICHFP